MKILFAGTPAVALPALEQLYNSGHEIVAVLTRPDAPIGRKRVLTPSPVAVKAQELGLPIIKADRVNAEVLDQIRATGAQLGVVVAYGALIGPKGLALLPHGWTNLHFSLLPAWRGAAPVQHAILSGQTRTGVSIFRLVSLLDAGPLYATQETEITERSTSGELLNELADSGAELLVEVVNQIESGSAELHEQVGESSYAPKLSTQDALIRWDRPAHQVLRQINAMSPEPGAFTWLGPTRVKITRASLGTQGSGNSGAGISEDGISASNISANETQGAPGAPLPPGSLSVVQGPASPGPAHAGTNGTNGPHLMVSTSDSLLEIEALQPAGKKEMSAEDWVRGQQGNSEFPPLRFSESAWSEG